MSSLSEKLWWEVLALILLWTRHPYGRSHGYDSETDDIVRTEATITGVEADPAS